jgi:ketosteroid isomerase-like protein
MPRENAETARRWLAALSSGDFDAAVALLHPAVVVVAPAVQAPYEGVEAVRRWMEPDAFRRLDIELLETLTVSDTRLLARHRVKSLGRSTGLEVDVISWSVWAFDDDGRIARIEIYLDRDKDKALESARRAVELDAAGR